ncbi:hypothetical protein BG003_004789 [Podila horticola]|nr:hypothetical protein BG003_004789 [Podila horticola]
MPISTTDTKFTFEATDLLKDHGVKLLFHTMRLGILKDEERRANKKRQGDNVLEFAIQLGLQRKMLEEQSVRK